MLTFASFWLDVAPWIVVGWTLAFLALLLLVIIGSCRAAALADQREDEQARRLEEIVARERREERQRRRRAQDAELRLIANLEAGMELPPAPEPPVSLDSVRDRRRRHGGAA